MKRSSFFKTLFRNISLASNVQKTVTTIIDSPHEVNQYQYLFDNWQNAINKKQAIIDNQGAYYYQIRIKDVHKTMFRHSKTHLETRFNHDRFNRDISNADHQINICTHTINAVQHKYNAQIAVLTVTKNTNNQAFDNLKISIANLKNQIQANYIKENQLNNAILQINVKISELQTLNDNAQIALDQISALNAEVKEQNNQVLENAKNIQTEISKLKAELGHENQEIVDQLIELSADQRSEVIAKFFNDSEFSSQLEIVKKMDFDVDYLAYLAVQTNQSNLLELAIEHGANCATCAIEGLTILQKAIIEGKDELIKKIVSSGDFESVLLNAIKKDDLVTFDKIISVDNSYLHKNYYGLTLLQISISGGKTALIDKLINLDPSCINKLSVQKESAFKFALNSGDEQIIVKLAKFVDIEKELAGFINDAELIQKALELLELPSNTLQNLLKNSVNSMSESLMQNLKNKGANLDLIFEEAITQKDYDTLQSLVIFNDSYLEVIEQHADIFECLIGAMDQQANCYIQI